MHTLDRPETVPPDDAAAAQTMYVILYPDTCEEEVVQPLEDESAVPPTPEDKK